MSHLFQVEKINFLCSCGMSKPITAVYFCRHCLKLRCGNCVSHEVDTLYCPHCLENMPSTEAKLKKNRCANCFDCPCCAQPLSTKASTIQVPNTEDPSSTVSRKVYYLGCTSCRWTSKDSGLEDQTTATGGWGERDSPNYKRIQDLFDHYRSVAQKEKLENEKEKSSRKRSSYLGITEKYSLSSSFSSLMSRKSIGGNFSLKGEAGSVLQIEPSVAVDDLPQVPPELFSDPIDLNKITTLEQRLSSPEFQPMKTFDLYPLHKHILVKKSHRCRQCEHNLSKPEYNPSSIKFKIQLGAYYHVPEIRLVRHTELKAGVATTCELSFCNPTPHDMKVALLPFDKEAYLQSLEESESAPVSSGVSARVVQLPRVTTSVNVTASVVLPQGEVTLAARDDTAEYDDADTASSYNDDPGVVVWRRANKVGIRVSVTADEGVSTAVFGLRLRYDYTNTVATAAENRTVTLDLPVLVTAGTVVQ